MSTDTSEIATSEIAAKFPVKDIYAVHPTEGTPILITVGELGFARISTTRPIDELNDQATLPHHIEAAVSGSLFGWHVPAADPDLWLQRLGQRQHVASNDMAHDQVTPLILSASDREFLRSVLQASTGWSAHSKALLARIDAGGDRIVVQAGIEGGVVQGWTSNCPVDAIIIEWDEITHVVVGDDGSTKLIGCYSGVPRVDHGEASKACQMRDHAIEINCDQVGIVLIATDGHRWTQVVDVEKSIDVDAVVDNVVEAWMEGGELRSAGEVDRMIVLVRKNHQRPTVHAHLSGAEAQERLASTQRIVRAAPGLR